MKLPPLVARVRVRTRAHLFRLWVPLFLLWLLLFLLLAPLLLVATLVTLLAAPRWRFGRLARGVYVTVCETRGAHVEVEGDRTGVSIALH